MNRAFYSYFGISILIALSKKSVFEIRTRDMYIYHPKR
jgi:hypothetical protein